MLLYVPIHLLCRLVKLTQLAAQQLVQLPALVPATPIQRLTDVHIGLYLIWQY